MTRRLSFWTCGTIEVGQLRADPASGEVYEVWSILRLHGQLIPHKGARLPENIRKVQLSELLTWPVVKSSKKPKLSGYGQWASKKAKHRDRDPRVVRQKKR